MICKCCGARNEEHNKICSFCGAILTEEEDNGQSNITNYENDDKDWKVFSGKKKKPLLAVSAGLAALALLVSGFFIIQRVSFNKAYTETMNAMSNYRFSSAINMLYDNTGDAKKGNMNNLSFVEAPSVDSTILGLFSMVLYDDVQPFSALGPVEYYLSDGTLFGRPIWIKSGAPILYRYSFDNVGHVSDAEIYRCQDMSFLSSGNAVAFNNAIGQIYHYNDDQYKNMAKISFQYENDRIVAATIQLRDVQNRTISVTYSGESCTIRYLPNSKYSLRGTLKGDAWKMVELSTNNAYVNITDNADKSYVVEGSSQIPNPVEWKYEIDKTHQVTSFHISDIVWKYEYNSRHRLKSISCGSQGNEDWGVKCTYTRNGNLKEFDLHGSDAVNVKMKYKDGMIRSMDASNGSQNDYLYSTEGVANTFTINQKPTQKKSVFTFDGENRLVSIQSNSGETLYSTNRDFVSNIIKQGF